ncbi:LytR/AlgR family response regulator transcription factor [Aquimarina hainanensis]|uniref:LytR/AlgR family response regulator transcription factor n=2 Tax=Aquimarina hainanensis TaxID=1578017 RepID=A0ABW5NCF6_9FLAO|nr:response regulator [Aquimarina sp. TRL1]QKX06942.1 response regulator [Aquimarina sp. TRL1]
MGSFNAIVVDDEERARNVLTQLLKRYTTTIKIVAQCASLTEAIQEINDKSPDVVFLDVQMPNYAGYEIASFFDTIDFEIIFVTAYDQYAIKAFELNAIDYLVKPIDRNRLITAVQKLEAKISIRKKLADYQLLLSTIKKKEFKQIIIPELGNRRVIPIEDILAIEADGAYSKIHLVQDKVITTSKNLKYFDSLFPDDHCFFRSHRTWIVHLKHVVSLHKSKLIISLLNSDLQVKVSRAKLTEFQEVIQ